MSAEIKPTPTDMEPTATSAAMPVWLIMGALLLLVWGAVHFDQHGGWFNPKIYTPYATVADVERWQPVLGTGPEAVIKRGKVIFENNCAICHNNDGMGKPGQFPPLAGSEWVNAEGVNRIIRIPLLGLSGPIEVKGQAWNAAMPTMGALKDKDIADALSYVRNSWGNKGSIITEKQVSDMRKELGSRAQALTADELKKLPEK